MTLSNDEMPLHPDLNAIAAFADGRLSTADRAALVGHLTDCAECRSTLAALARGLPRSARFVRTAGWLSLAATLVLAATVGTIVWRAHRGVQSAAGSPAGRPTAEPGVPASGIARPPFTGSPAPQPGPPTETPSLADRRGAIRQVGGKTFRLVAGEWLDSAYDPVGLLPVERVDEAGARAALLARIPALQPFAALGPRVLVMYDGAVYRFNVTADPSSTPPAR